MIHENKYSLMEITRMTRHGRDYVKALIDTGQLVAHDERAPGSSLPRWVIYESDFLRWKESTTHVPKQSRTQQLPDPPVSTGLLRRRREKQFSKHTLRAPEHARV